MTPETRTAQEINDQARFGTFEKTVFTNEQFAAAVSGDYNTCGFYDCRFPEALSYTTSGNGEELRFVGCEFEQSACFTNLTDEVLTFQNCIFHDDAIATFVKMGSLDFSLCTFHKNVYSKGVYAEGLSFYRCSVAGYAQIAGGIKYLTIQYNSLFAADISGYTNDMLDAELSGHGKEARTKSHSIESLNLFLTANSFNQLYIDNYRIGRIYIGGHSKGVLNFRSCTGTEVYIEGFVNEGIIKCSDFRINTGSQLIVRNSNLGKTELHAIDFSCFDKVDIFNSNIKDIIPANVKWCKKIQGDQDNPTSVANQERETYRQLKIVSENAKDKPEELRFYALEMASYWKELKEGKESRKDRWLLAYNKWTNDNGLNYWKPLAIALIWTLITYVLNKYLIGVSDYSLRYLPQNIS